MPRSAPSISTGAWPAEMAPERCWLTVAKWRSLPGSGSAGSRIGGGMGRGIWRAGAVAMTLATTLALSAGAVAARHHAAHRHHARRAAKEAGLPYLRVPAVTKKTIDELNLEVAFRALTVTLPGKLTFGGSWTPNNRDRRYVGETVGTASHRPHDIFMEKDNLELPITGPGGKEATLDVDAAINAIRRARHQGLDLYLMAKGKAEIRATTHEVVFAFESEAYGGGLPCYYGATKLKGTYAFVAGGEATLEPVVSAKMSLYPEAESHPELCPASAVVNATLIAENGPGEPVTVVSP